MQKGPTGASGMFGTMTETLCSSGISKVCLFIIISTVISACVASALSINEVELNPSGDDAGNEWVELYSDVEVDLNGYYLANSDSQIYNLTGNFSGYYVVTFPKQWLDNKDEIVVLLKGVEVIAITDNLSDSKNDDFTWSYCDGWTFNPETKGSENKCSEGNNDNNNENETEDNIPEDNEPDEETNDQNNTVETTPEVASDIVPLSDVVSKKQTIILENPKNSINEDKTYISNEGLLRNSMIYIFSGLCMLLLALVAMNKLK